MKVDLHLIVILSLQLICNSGAKFEDLKKSYYERVDLPTTPRGDDTEYDHVEGETIITEEMHPDGGIEEFNPEFANEAKSGEWKYIFKASSSKKRVLLTFPSFSLYSGHRNSGHRPTNIENCTEQDDRITIQIKAEVGVINPKLDSYLELKTYCGGGSEPPRIMSSGYYIEALFQTGEDRKSKNVAKAGGGFNYSIGYKFVDNFGIETGEQIKEKGCKFIYRSSASKRGRVTSPNPGGYYPRNTDCEYVFKGNADEKVTIQFIFFLIEGAGTCGNDSLSDYVEFSNFETKDKKIPRYCSKKPIDESASDKDYYRMIFHSNGLFDGRGFDAHYQFIHRERKAAIKSVRVGSCGTARFYKELLVFAFLSYYLTSLHAR